MGVRLAKVRIEPLSELLRASLAEIPYQSTSPGRGGGEHVQTDPARIRRFGRGPHCSSREGALLAKQCGAEVFLLSVLTDTGTLLLSEVTLAGATVQMEEDFREILDEGIARLRKLGFDPVAELVRGQPAEEIGKFAKQVGADLIIVGHRLQSAFDRWGQAERAPI